MDGQPGDEAGCLDGVRMCVAAVSLDDEVGREPASLVGWFVVELSAWMVRMVVRLSAWSFGWSAWMVRMVVRLSDLSVGW